MSALYGIYPAKFVRRDRRDTRTFEEVDVQWLLAAWPSYMAAIEPEDNSTPRIYEITQQGIPTGALLIGVSAEYRCRTIEDELCDDLVDEITKEINNKTLATLRQTLTIPRGQRLCLPTIGSQVAAVLKGVRLMPPGPGDLLTEIDKVSVEAKARERRASFKIDLTRTR